MERESTNRFIEPRLRASDILFRVSVDSGSLAGRIQTLLEPDGSCLGESRSVQDARLCKSSASTAPGGRIDSPPEAPATSIGSTDRRYQSAIADEMNEVAVAGLHHVDLCDSKGRIDTAAIEIR